MFRVYVNLFRLSIRHLSRWELTWQEVESYSMDRQSSWYHHGLEQLLDDYLPGAAASLREGREDTLTVLRLDAAHPGPNLALHQLREA
jgi:hypothetical protein